MHGPKHSNTFTRILALDLGKFNSVACVYERATHEHRFLSVPTTPKMIHDLLVEHQSSDPSQNAFGDGEHRTRNGIVFC